MEHRHEEGHEEGHDALHALDESSLAGSRASAPKRDGSGGARDALPLVHTDGSWRADAEVALQRVIDKRRKARDARRRELDERQQRRARDMGAAVAKPSQGEASEAVVEEGAGDDSTRSAASRLIDRKPKLTANALERLAKLRDLMEQQKF